MNKRLTQHSMYGLFIEGAKRLYHHVFYRPMEALLTVKTEGARNLIRVCLVLIGVGVIAWVFPDIQLAIEHWKTSLMVIAMIFVWAWFKHRKQISAFETKAVVALGMLEEHEGRWPHGAWIGSLTKQYSVSEALAVIDLLKHRGVVIVLDDNVRTCVVVR